jgi:hypothetical protein
VTGGANRPSSGGCVNGTTIQAVGCGSCLGRRTTHIQPFAVLVTAQSRTSAEVQDEDERHPSVFHEVVFQAGLA